MSFPWTKEDEEKLALLLNDKSLTLASIGLALGKTKKSVSGKMVRLGIAKGYHCWPQSEVDALVACWPHKSPQEISDIIGRTVPAIQRKAFFLKLPLKGRVLRTIPCQICSVMLESVAPNRKYCTACYDELQRKSKKSSRIKKPRLDMWPQERTDRLIALREKNTPVRVIAFILGIPKNAVSGKLHRLGLCHPQTKENHLANASLGGLVTKRARAKARGIRKIAPIKPYTKPIIKPERAIHLPKPDSLNIPFKAIKSRQCRYMEGEDHICCGHETRLGLSWCDFHFLMVYRNDRRTTSVANLHQQLMAYS